MTPSSSVRDGAPWPQPKPDLPSDTSQGFSVERAATPAQGERGPMVDRRLRIRGGKHHGSRDFWLGIAVTALAVVVSSGIFVLGYSSGRGAVPVLDSPVPVVRVANLIPGASDISTASFQASAVVLNFWGSWCPPCKAEMPALQAVHRELGNRVIFIGIDEADTRQAATGFLHRVGVTYSDGFDPDAAVGRSFDIAGTPTTYFISKGRELDYTLGPITGASLRKNIRQYFGVS
jgi:thiol-disulfide isomerase/thioredoxin